MHSQRKNGNEGVRGRRLVGGWEGCAGVAREFADTTKRRQKRIFERRGTADLIAKSLNNYPVNTLHACKRRARRAHAQASGTHQTTKLSNGKLKRRRRRAIFHSVHNSARASFPGDLFVTDTRSIAHYSLCNYACGCSVFELVLTRSSGEASGH